MNAARGIVGKHVFLSKIYVTKISVIAIPVKYIEFLTNIM